MCGHIEVSHTWPLAEIQYLQGDLTPKSGFPLRKSSLSRQ